MRRLFNLDGMAGLQAELQATPEVLPEVFVFLGCFSGRIPGAA